MKTKICTKCKELKSIEDFSKNKINKDGYQNQCNNCKSIYNKERWKNNKEHVKKLNYKWRDNNREHVREYQKKIDSIYKPLNKDKTKLYNEKRKDINRIYQKKYKKEKYQNDENFRMKVLINSLIRYYFRKYFNNNVKYPIKFLGCSIEEFKLHLESKFKPWMNWDNQGNPKDGIYEPNKTWDIDHIIPISSAKNEEDYIKLSHYSNFQPLCSYENRFIKKNKIPLR